MGNKSSNNKSSTSSKFVMPLSNQQIILSQPLHMVVTIGQLQVFPHGLDGLKLWDAGIILSRYIIKNCEIFNKKDVLELGSGVGIGGITLRKWTEASRIVMSDYHTSITENIKKNCFKNQIPTAQNDKPAQKIIYSKVDVINLDWREASKYTQKFDFIIGSDIVYFGCPVQDLYKLFKQHLKQKGHGLIVIPDRKNYAQLFEKLIQPEQFELKIEDLSNEQYSQPVLQNIELSRNKYDLLGNIKFLVYHLIKK